MCAPTDWLTTMLIFACVIALSTTVGLWLGVAMTTAASRDADDEAFFGSLSHYNDPPALENGSVTISSLSSSGETSLRRGHEKAPDLAIRGSE